MQCDERRSVGGKEREREGGRGGNFICANIRNANQRDNS